MEQDTSPQSTKFDITSADFKLFLVIWNQRQNQTTPDIHLNMAGWLERRWNAGDTRLLLMAFRSAGKSTIVGLFAAWLLYRNPDLRILVLAADYTLAKKMVGNVKRILERHPLTANGFISLKPDRAEQWAGDRFTVKRMAELRDPSMLAKGITSNITGSRADIIICDDVEVPNTCDSPEKRRDLRERLSELEFVLVPDGTQIYVGTPHHYNTIYAANPRAELGEEAVFLSGFKSLKLPIIDENGQSAWPERYGTQQINRMKRTSGPNRFASQMMLQPRNIAEGRLNVDLLRVYDLQLDHVKELNSLYLSPVNIPSPHDGYRSGEGQGGGAKPIKLVSSSAYWDPAFGSAKGDHSVMAVIYSDADGNYYLHHVEYIKLPSPRCHPRESGDLVDQQTDSGVRRNDDFIGDDEATQQCKIVAAIAKSHYLPSLTLETNGIGKFLPAMLRNELAKSRAPCAVREIHQSRNKDDRIIDGFDAVLAARRLYVHKNVLKTPFMTEMREWRPKDSMRSNKGHDDGIDAVAGALLQAPERLTRIYGAGAQSWAQTGRAHKAETDFKI
ncbi:MAG: phage terminase large subunit [Bdellovibrionales bacterium]